MIAACSVVAIIFALWTIHRSRGLRPMTELARPRPGSPSQSIPRISADVLPCA